MLFRDLNIRSSR